MLNVELIYDADCPNVGEAREKLLRAFARMKLSPKWQEWERSSKESPSYAGQYGSPSILINGKDCTGQPALENADCCRVYRDKDGSVSGTPSEDVIVFALARALETVGEKRTEGKAWASNLAVISSIGFALLPKLACPACWPAYAGLLTAVGLGFLVNEKYLLALTLGFLGLAVGALAFRARARRGYGPFWLGLLASLLVIGGKFCIEWEPVMYLGIANLVLASVWNSWPRGLAESDSCPSCASAESLTK